jgi:hypothetical protein
VLDFLLPHRMPGSGKGLGSSLLIVVLWCFFSLVQVADAVNLLYPEFMRIDAIVAKNLDRVLNAYASARVGTHVRIFSKILQ